MRSDVHIYMVLLCREASIPNRNNDEEEDEEEDDNDSKPIVAAVSSITLVKTATVLGALAIVSVALFKWWRRSRK